MDSKFPSIWVVSRLCWGICWNRDLKPSMEGFEYQVDDLVLYFPKLISEEKLI